MIETHVKITMVRDGDIYFKNEYLYTLYYASPDKPENIIITINLPSQCMSMDELKQLRYMFENLDYWIPQNARFLKYEVEKINKKIEKSG